MTNLGQLLVDQGLVTQDDYARARAVQREGGASIGATLVRIGAISEEMLLQAISRQVGMPMLDPQQVPNADMVSKTIAELAVPPTWFADNDVIAWRREGDGGLRLAGPRLHEPQIQEALEHWRPPGAEQFLATAILLEPILITLRGAGGDAGADDPSRLMELAEEAPVIDFVNAVFADALAAEASDIHFEPFEDRIVVRLRIDGVLQQRRTASRHMFDAITSRIKLLSGMDIAERRLPQDGRQSIRVCGRDLDVRVSTLPTTWGESTVIRLLGDARHIPALADLGLTPTQQQTILGAIAQPNGLVLITGPTGSGKTTSVYRLISGLNDGVKKIVTIEDPVEFDLPGVLQMTVRADIDLDFAAGLRSILRQDPDVIFVGEVRDAETARTAVQAALTGHLVISTVHTNSAFAAVARLVDLGVERFLLADVLRVVVGQRLVRKLCSRCARASANDNSEARALEILKSDEGKPQWRASVGCSACARSGFRGRLGVFEAARIDATLQQAIRAGASEAEMITMARAAGFTNLVQNGVARARAGETTMAEALRVLGESSA